MQEPREPDALALTLVADAVHAIVPVAGADQRQAMRAGGKTEVEAARAVLEKRCRFVGLVGQEVEIVLAGANSGAVDERHLLVEDRGVTGGLYIVRCDRGEPRPVIGDARAHTLAGRRKPPMLDVALDELPAGGT